MKFARTLVFAGLAGSTVTAILLAQGCSSSSATQEETVDSGGKTSSTSSTKTSGSTTTTASNTSTSGSSVGTTAAPTPDAGAVGMPPMMMGAAQTNNNLHNFAVHNLYLGDDNEDATFTANPNAWKTLGYNIDGLVTTAKSTDVCKPYTNGVTAQQIDGTNGIDNAFGAIIVPALGMLGINLSQTVSGKIAAGAFTILINTKGLDATMASQTNTALGGALFAGAPYTGGVAPPETGMYFSLADNWPVDQALLNPPPAGMKPAVSDGSKINFPAAYVTAGTWVSGTPVNLTLSLSLEGQTLGLTIHNAVMSFDYSVASGQGLAKNGIISGVLNTVEFLTAINQVVGNIGTPPGTDCSLVSIVALTIQGAQDIVINADGSVSNTAGTDCNGISIGLGFTADEIAQPSVVAPTTDAGAGNPPCSSGDAGS